MNELIELTKTIIRQVNDHTAEYSGVTGNQELYNKIHSWEAQLAKIVQEMSTQK